MLDETESLLSEFRDKATALGVTVSRSQNESRAATVIAGWMGDLGSEVALASRELSNAAPGLVSGLAGAGIMCNEPGSPEEVRDAPVGISLAHLAIAETGSTLLVEPSLADRSVSMLTLSLVIVCPTRCLTATLDATPELLRHAVETGGSYATLVTGPSRTADIERVLTVGVQGPGKVHVVFVDTL